MLIEREHPLTGKTNTLDLPVTPEQMEQYVAGSYAQEAFPHLDADQREFIITGLLPGEFDEMFGDEGDDL